MNNAAYLPGFIILAVVVAVNPRGVSRGATADQDWVAYEGIQANIFDHLLAVVSQFDLRIYQRIGNAGARVQERAPQSAAH